VLELTPRATNPPSGPGLVELLSDRWSSHQNDTFHVWFEIDITSAVSVSRKAVALQRSIAPQS
jgi:hypothetical protein